MTATTKASNAVFDTVELLENILNQLPCKNIVRAQQVSKYCQAVIAGSKNLRQRIFLEPIAHGVAYEDELKTLGGLQREEDDYEAIKKFPKGVLELAVQLHPAVNKADFSLFTVRKSPTFGEYTDLTIPFDIINEWSSTGLRDMLVFQPPIKYIYGGVHRWQELKVATGTTFGALHDWLMSCKRGDAREIRRSGAKKCCVCVPSILLLKDEAKVAIDSKVMRREKKQNVNDV